MSDWFGYRWFCVRLWLLQRPDKIAWWLAWAVPRKVALYAYVRVFTCDAWDYDANHEEYRRHYQSFEAGKGK